MIRRQANGELWQVWFLTISHGLCTRAATCDTGVEGQARVGNGNTKAIGSQKGLSSNSKAEQNSSEKRINLVVTHDHGETSGIDKETEKAKIEAAELRAAELHESTFSLQVLNNPSADLSLKEGAQEALLDIQQEMKRRRLARSNGARVINIGGVRVGGVVGALFDSPPAAAGLGDN
jgi:hypothetical protein